MKKTIIIILLAMTSIISSAHNNEQEHTLTKLWNQFYKAQKKDLPQDQLLILEQIRTQASEQRIHWDFYDACQQYADIQLRSNWKLRFTSQTQLRKLIEDYDEPIVRLAYYISHGQAGINLMSFISSHSEALMNTHNPPFYRNNLNFEFSEALYQLIDNDYDYALWLLLSQNKRDEAAAELARQSFKDSIQAPLLEYLLIDKQDKEQLYAFAQKYDHLGISIYAQEHLLQMHFDELIEKKANSQEYKELDKEAAAIIQKKAQFKGKERIVASARDLAAQIRKELRSRMIDAKIELGILELTLRNIPHLNLRIYKENKVVHTQSIINDARSFYATDSILVTLPELPDGEYSIECQFGIIKVKSDYDKHSLSIAVRTHSEGKGVFVTDYLSGKPIENCTLHIYHRDQLLDTLTINSSDGFAPLPESLLSRLQDLKYDHSIQASCIDGNGNKCTSRLFSLYKEYTSQAAIHRCSILLDRKAFKPGETVQFKAICYRDAQELELLNIQKLEAKLFDSEHQCIDSLKMSLNEYGSASGSFTLSTDRRNGEYSIEIYEASSSIGRERFIVDSFVLPNFEIIWDKSERIYLPGDTIKMSGLVRAYSGHNLSSASRSYTISQYNNVLYSSELKIDKDGHFSIEYRSEDTEWAVYNIAIKIIDATGESLESSRSCVVSNSFYPQNRILNTQEGQAKHDESFYDIVEDSLVIEAPIDYPRVKRDYSIKQNDTEILSGVIDSDAFRIDLSSFPSGLYSLDFKTTLTSEIGKNYSEESKHHFYLIHKDDKMLTTGLDCFFRNKSDDSLSVEVAACNGPLWIIAELFEDENKLIGSKIFYLERPDHLYNVGFERKSEYSGDLRLELLYFNKAKCYRYSREFDLAQTVLPLQFTRFLDTTAPCTDYTLEIQTASNVECAASIFDVSTEVFRANPWRIIIPTSRYSRQADYKYLVGVNEGMMYYIAQRQIRTNHKTGFRMLSHSLSNESHDACAYEEATSPAYGSTGLESIELEAVEPRSVRKDFASSIAWEPMLRSDDQGRISLHFTTSDKLSRYKVQLFAHDKSLHNNILTRELTVTLPVKVSLVQPLYLYDKDQYTARISVENSSDKDVQGEVFLQTKGGKRYSKNIEVKAHQGADFSHSIAIQSNLVGLYAGFIPIDNESAADVVYVEIPVQKSAQILTESHSELVRDTQDKDMIVKRLRSQFVNFNASSAKMREIKILDMLLEALPKNIEAHGEDAISLADALYARHLLSEARKLAEQFGYKSELSYTKMSDSELTRKLIACVADDGGFSWYEGMRSSPAITAAVLKRLLPLGDDCPQSFKPFIPAAANYLDRIMLSDKHLPLWCGWISIEQYLEVRSRCGEIGIDTNGASLERIGKLRKEIKEYLLKEGLNAQIYDKAVRIVTLEALSANKGAFASFWGLEQKKMKTAAKDDIASLEQYAQPHSSGAWYFPNAVMPFRGLLDSELHAHSLLCGIMERNGKQDIAEGLRLWIMIQKETQNWHKDSAYLEALACVLAGKQHTLESSVIELSASGELAYEKIKTAGNGFTLKAEYYREGKLLKGGEVLKVGDKIETRFEVWNAENRSFVKLTAPRPASWRPVKQLSGLYGWWLQPLRIDNWYSFTPQAYREVKEDKSIYAFDCFPEETLTISEEYYVTQEGIFHCGAASIECLYAPHYRANSQANIWSSK